jgi:hypothetical protein
MQSDYERVALHIISRLSDHERNTIVKASTPAMRKTAPTLLETCFAMVVRKYANEIQSPLKLRAQEVKDKLARECVRQWEQQV